LLILLMYPLSALNAHIITPIKKIQKTTSEITGYKSIPSIALKTSFSFT
jgi:hypothetical protein